MQSGYFYGKCTVFLKRIRDQLFVHYKVWQNSWSWLRKVLACFPKISEHITWSGIYTEEQFLTTWKKTIQHLNKITMNDHIQLLILVHSPRFVPPKHTHSYHVRLEHLNTSSLHAHTVETNTKENPTLNHKMMSF